jgi:uncharacterized LabA/DUF88 family protein
MLKRLGQRVAVFVDNENLFYGMRDHQEYGREAGSPYRINYEALWQKLVGDREVVQSVIYCAIRVGADPTNFFHKLQHCGFEVKAKRGVFIQKTQVYECDWDMGIAIDIMQVIDRVDVVALVTSDSDFTPLVEHVRNRGRTLELHSWIPFSRKDFQQSASFFFPLGADILEKDTDPNPLEDLDAALTVGSNNGA